MPVADAERARETLSDAARDDPGLSLTRHLGAEDDELVTAEPRGRVRRADGLQQPLGDLDEERVADIMAQPVVDLLEAVQVDEQQRDRAGDTVSVGEVTSRP